MVTLISYALVMLGAANWLCIGLMQYDFVAGFFGTQSSFLSRFVYIVVGFAAIWLLIATIKGRGTVKINSNIFAKKRQNQNSIQQNTQTYNQNNINRFPQEYQTDTNIELGNEIHQSNSHTHHNPFD
jgi:uncharacterized membrane protein YuzA (DUF378 family)